MRKIIYIICALIAVTCGTAVYTATAESDINTANLVSIKTLDSEESFVSESTIDFYRNLVDDLALIEVFDTSEYSADMLRNRNGKLMIEECISVVTGAESDGAMYGTILNCGNPDYAYIGYRGIDVEIGDIVLTYFLYNPDTEFEDDILCRFDYVIDSLISLRDAVN